MRKSALLLLSIALAAPASAAAQELTTPSLQQSGGTSIESRRLQLAEILGTLHYVRVLCEPADGEFWRDRMMEMIRLEKPSLEQRNKLINEFNAGYEIASGRFAACTPEARSFASDTAREGEAIAQALSDAITPSG